MERELELRLSKNYKVTRKFLLLVFMSGLYCSLNTFCLVPQNIPELLYVNWRAIFQQIILYALLIVYVILGYLQSYYRRYGMLRIFLYLVFVSSTSYVVVAHCLDNLALISWDLLKGNVIRRLNDSIIVIDENRNESTSVLRTADPFLREEHFRYNKEDITFTWSCELSFKSEVEPLESQVIWMHNEKTVVPSWKFHEEVSFIVTTCRDSIGLYCYSVSSTLTVYLLEDADYGNYSCHYNGYAKIKWKNAETKNNTTQQRPKATNKWKNDETKNNTTQQRPKATNKWKNDETKNNTTENLFVKFDIYEYLDHFLYQWSSEYKLTKIEKSIRTISAPPGGIISISASYLNLAEKQDISLDYVINDQPFIEDSTDQSNRCSMFVLLYWIFWHAEGHCKGIPYITSVTLHMSSSILGKGWQCSNPSTYGTHAFRFYRNFYNVTAGKHQLIEVEHHQDVRVIPRTADILLVFQNTSNPELLGEICLDSLSFSSSCAWLHAFNTYYFIIENIIFYSICCVCLLVAYIFCKLAMHWLMAFRNIILEKYPYHQNHETLGSIGHDDMPCKFDVYISHADSQWKLASELASLLESFGKKVYYRDRDVAIGDIEIASLSDAIVSSSMFLIIVTKEYINSFKQNKFEFSLMQSQIHEGKVSQKSVMFLKQGRCKIPPYFYNFTDIEIIDMDRSHADDLITKLKTWSRSKKDERLFHVSFLLLSFWIVLIALAVIVINNVTMDNSTKL